MALNTIVWDQTVVGFAARRQRRHVHYLLRYRINGRQRFLSIGKHGSPWTTETARTEARRLLGLVASKIDPAQEQTETDRATFGQTLTDYLERRRSALKLRSFQGMEAHLSRQCKSLHGLSLKQITRREIAILLADVEQNSGPASRNRVRTSLSAFFAFAIREGLLEANPVLGTGKADEGPSRDRVLSETELKTLWQSLGDDEFSSICKLLILTAQRRTEIGSLRWSEVDFENSVINFPPERTKNSKPHSLPMSRQVRTILQRRYDRRNGSEYVFGSNGHGFSSWSEAKNKLDDRLNGMKEWRLHDCRRSAATLMCERIGVQPHIVEHVLNHISGYRAGVTGIYLRAKYTEEMRSALDAWGKWVDRLRPGGP